MSDLRHDPTPSLVTCDPDTDAVEVKCFYCDFGRLKPDEERVLYAFCCDCPEPPRIEDLCSGSQVGELYCTECGARASLAMLPSEVG